MLRVDIIASLKRVLEAAMPNPETRHCEPLAASDVAALETILRTIAASRWALISDEELEGLARDLKPATPWLIDVNAERARRRMINAERGDSTLRPLAWGPAAYRTNQVDEIADRNGDRYMIRRGRGKDTRFILTVNGEWHGGYGTQAGAREAADNIMRNRTKR